MKKEVIEGRLFKYQIIDKWTKKNLKNNELFFNNPEDFNDPFDGKVDVFYRGTRKEWSKWVLEQNKIKEKNIDQWIKDKIIIEENGIFELDTKNNIFKDFEKHHFKICCFCETYSNILMWSHYAEKHKGICLCFRTYKEGNYHNLRLDPPLPYPLLFPVEYDKPKPKRVNMLTIQNEEYRELMDFYIRKYQDWKYEKEHRRLIFDEAGLEKGFTKKFIKEDLEGIIFGFNAERKKIKQIYNIVNTYYLKQGIKVNFYNTHKIQGEFAIGVKKIESIKEYYHLEAIIAIFIYNLSNNGY